MKNVASSWNYASGINYTPAGSLSAVSFHNGISETRSWNDRLQETQVLAAKLYGNRWVINDFSGITIPANTAQSQSAFDASTNRINQNGAIMDSAGNLQQVGAETFTYDAENRMVGSTLGATSVAYAYDGEGRRVQKTYTSTDPAKTTTITYIYDAQGQAAAEYVSGTLPNTATCNLCYFTTDHLGSTRVLSNENGDVVARHDFMPFWRRDSRWHWESRLRFVWGVANPTLKSTGKERDSKLVNSADPNGLDYFGARYFSGAQGRFTSPDEVACRR